MNDFLSRAIFFIIAFDRMTLFDKFEKFIALPPDQALRAISQTANHPHSTTVMAAPKVRGHLDFTVSSQGHSQATQRRRIKLWAYQCSFGAKHA
jgi:hypothetical protein